jgi:hypothetical protein
MNEGRRMPPRKCSLFPAVFELLIAPAGTLFGGAQRTGAYAPGWLRTRATLSRCLSSNLRMSRADMKHAQGG